MSSPHLLGIEGSFVEEQPALLAGSDTRHELLIVPAKEFKNDDKEQEEQEQEYLMASIFPVQEANLYLASFSSP